MSFAFAFNVLLFSVVIIYSIETLMGESSIPDMVQGIYWGFITITSVGYGDISPATYPGKILSGIFAIIGFALFSIPAGVIGFGFALKVSERKRKEFFSTALAPAAVKIQTVWRYRQIRKTDSLKLPTWRHLLSLTKKNNTPAENYTQQQKMLVIKCVMALKSLKPFKVKGKEAFLDWYDVLREHEVHHNQQQVHIMRLKNTIAAYRREMEKWQEIIDDYYRRRQIIQLEMYKSANKTLITSMKM